MKTTLSLAALCLLGTQALNLESISKRSWSAPRVKAAGGATKKTVRGIHKVGKTTIGGSTEAVKGLWAQTEAEANTDAEFCGGCGLGYGGWGFGGYGLGGCGGYGGWGGGCGGCWAETESETQVDASSEQVYEHADALGYPFGYA